MYEIKNHKKSTHYREKRNHSQIGDSSDWWNASCISFMLSIDIFKEASISIWVFFLVMYRTYKLRCTPVIRVSIVWSHSFNHYRSVLSHGSRCPVGVVSRNADLSNMVWLKTGGNSTLELASITRFVRVRLAQKYVGLLRGWHVSALARAKTRHRELSDLQFRRWLEARRYLHLHCK